MTRPSSRPSEKAAQFVQPTAVSEDNDSNDIELSAGGNEKRENVTIASDNTIDPSIPEGVRKAEAITLSWSRKTLILIYIHIFIIFFVNTLGDAITGNLTAYVTSAFAEHELTATTSVVSSIMAGVMKLPIAQMINGWGRAEGFSTMVFCTTIGYIMMAACQNVQTYAAAQVFFWVGYDGIMYILDVIIADTSNLKDRAFFFAYSTSPYLVTIWVGPRAASAFYYHSTGFRWAFGAWAIITPFICAPLFFTLFYEQRKATREGKLEKGNTRTLSEKIKHVFIEGDVFGIILISAGFVLFLLAFSLAGATVGEWKSARIICMLVFGILCLIAFAFYEAFFSPKTFIPFHFLKDPNILGPCCLAAVVDIAFYCWDGYFLSYLQVVFGLSLANAGYLANTYTMGSCLWGLVIGVIIRYTGRYKWLCAAHTLLLLLGCALMIHFRQPGINIGYVVMCQIFIAFGGGCIVICQQMQVMAAGGHENIAPLLALLGLFSSVGSAIGSTISSAIWTSNFPEALLQALPEGSKADYETIYGSLSVQLTYEMGSEVRDAIIVAYAQSQKKMCIAATSVMVLGFFCVVVWKDFNTKNMRQVKGTVI